MFTLYLNWVNERWWDRRRVQDVKVFYKYDGKLVGKAPLSFKLTELLFADDGAILCYTRQDIKEAARVVDETAAEFGLTISVVKTKLLVAGCHLRRMT